MAEAKVILVDQIEPLILEIRGQKVLLDKDLAGLYGVATKRLNEQVRRNRKRFPVDFLFRLTAKEKDEVVANCDHLANLRFSPQLPYAFTESWCDYGRYHPQFAAHSRGQRVRRPSLCQTQALRTGPQRTRGQA